MAVVLGISLVASCMASSVSAIGSADTAQDSFIQKMNDKFQDPELDYHPEARWWLAEGSHTDETLKESIHELYNNGFGAVEFVTLDESAYLDDATYAWGSEEWIHDTHVIMEECNKLGMGVSFTSGTNWATANLTNITPDDESASQELSYKTVELSAGETFNSVLPTPELPEDVTKLKFVKVIAAKRAEPGSNQLVEDSLTDISDQVIANGDGTWNINYTAPDDGDYILFGFWQHGTGESRKPAVTGKSYTINYFDKAGTNALIQYWDENVLTDEMKSLIKENGDVSMYMDSLELGTRGKDSTKNLWCTDFLEQFEQRCGYDASKYLPILIMSSGGGFGSVPAYPYTLAENEEKCDGIRNDLFQVNTELYMDNCLDVLTEWLHGLGMTLRAENSYGQLLEISQPIKSLDYVETESLEFGVEMDSYRSQAGGAHLYNKLFSSETGAILGGNYKNNNHYFRQMFYTQFAAGIQRTVVHGYSSEYGPEQNVQWPGYEGMGKQFAERFNKRQPNAIDYPEVMGEHITRLQKVLREGVPQMDLGILRTDYNLNNGIWNSDIADSAFHRQDGYYWRDQTLQNAGYTYDYFSPYLLQDSDISYADGLVQPDGPAYQALLIYQEEMPYESAQTLLQWAKNGLPIVIVEGETTEIIAGKNSVTKINHGGAITTGCNDGKDAELAQVMDEIKSLDNVAAVQTQEEAYDALIGLGVHPRAEYTESNQTLLSVMRKDDDASYLYLYNYMYENPDNYYTGQVAVDGIYQPYVLDTWSGNIEEINNCSYQDGKTILDVNLAPGEVMVFALDPNNQVENSVISSKNVQKSIMENGSNILYIPESGTASVQYADGKTYSTNVEVPEDIPLSTWDVTIQSWEPGDKITRSETRNGITTTEATYTTNKVDIHVGETELIPWKDMQQVGPEVSGVGTYTTTFNLPENWNVKTNGLEFCADSFCGGTAAIFVNGTQVPVDMDSCIADISDYVQLGENTIQVRVTSSLRNRMIEQQYSGWMGEMQPDNYGMTGDVVLQTYTKVATVNKGILNSVIAYAESAKASSEYDNAIESVQKSFDEALTNAKVVAENMYASQQEIDSAWIDLLNEIHKLGFTAGDKTELDQLIAAAEKIDLDKYVETGKTEFITALKEAQKVYQDGDAMQAEINEVADNLLNTMLNLRYKADKSILEEVLAAANNLDATTYTAESYSALIAAVAEANTVMDNENATQDEVDVAVANIQKAMDDLVTVEDTTTEIPSIEAVDGNTIQTGQETITAKTNAAKTGDFAPIAGLAAITLAGAALLFTRRKK